MSQEHLRRSLCTASCISMSQESLASRDALWQTNIAMENDPRFQ